VNAGKNNVIYMGLNSGPKMANGEYRKTLDAGSVDRESTVTAAQYANKKIQ
jgi:hypothetical protein